MWCKTLSVLMVISCLDAVTNAEDSVSSSTLEFIALAQCEAQCYSIEEERNGSTSESKDPLQDRNTRITECLNGLHIENSSEIECRGKCNDSKDCVKSCSCLNELRNSTVHRSVVEGPGPSAPQLHCREATMLSVAWECSGTPVFVLLMHSDEDSDWRPWNTTRKKLATLHDLTKNTLYQFRVLAILPDGQLGENSTSDWISTLNDTFNPGPVSDIRIVNTTSEPDGVNTTISWEPAWDRTCFYEVVRFSDTFYPEQILIEEPEKFEYIWDSQKFGTNYSIAIMGKNKDCTRESNKAWLNFSTPDCFYYYPNDLTKCVPPKPKNVSVKAKLKKSSKYDVTVSWVEPVLQPSYHLVKLFREKPEGSMLAESKVDGNETSVSLTEMDVGWQYKVFVTAVSPAGSSEVATITKKLKSPSNPDTSWNEVDLLLVILLPAVIMGVASVCIYLFHRNRKRFRHEQRSQYIETMYQTPSVRRECSSSVECEQYFDAKWEIPTENLVLGDVLGEGAFGIVRKGVLQEGKKRRDVAVKMLREISSTDDQRQFRQEINMLQSVGRHPHIVSLIGYCTRDDRLQLVVEYCAQGDLLNFLRKKRKKTAKVTGRTSAICNVSNKQKLSEEVQYLELQSMENTGDGVSDKQYPGMAVNQLYEIANGVDEISKQQKKQLSPADLLSLARQSAMGMEYLANNHVVHRDLAARNVLVCADGTVKISDFGMSRDVYESNVYHRKGSGRLPVKWMAPESLWNQVYTTKSDVWSFGILVWEIVTFGNNPYPGIPTDKLLRLLREGHRMQCPPNCSKELYNIMLACWAEKPKNRPTFTELHKKLDDLLEVSSPQQYLNFIKLQE